MQLMLRSATERTDLHVSWCGLPNKTQAEHKLKNYTKFGYTDHEFQTSGPNSKEKVSTH